MPSPRPASPARARCRQPRPGRSAAVSPKGALRRKEWTLLVRDPWLASQTLMQLLYLLPPGADAVARLRQPTADDLVLLVPVLVMAAGQLAGGLAWLAISGEDAPDLVTTAPIPAHWIVRAKVEAVAGGVAVVFAPFVIAMAIASPRDARGGRAGHRRRDVFLDPDPALVPHPGAAQALPPAADLVPACDLRRSIFLDRLGGDRRPCRRGSLAGRDRDGADRVRNSGGRAGSQSEAGAVAPNLTPGADNVAVPAWALPRNPTARMSSSCRATASVRRSPPQRCRCCARSIGCSRSTSLSRT